MIQILNVILKVKQVIRLKALYSPFSVNSQSGGKTCDKIVLHLKGLFLSGEGATIVLSSRLGITEMGLFKERQ